MYIEDYEEVKVVLVNKTQITKWSISLGITININEPFFVGWVFLKTKKEYRKISIKVKCDDCGELHDRRIRDLDPNNNTHFCKRCVKTGERGPMFGLYGENNPNFGQKRESVSGDKNPSKRPEVKDKISKSLKGRPSGMLGKKHRNETKEKIKISNTGQKRSKEVVDKIREKRKIQVGDKCPSWKGGITPVVRMARNHERYSIWRKSIFDRDEYICQVCKTSGKYLNGHHIVGVYENIDLIYNVDNGLTLCKDCHLLFHNKYGRKGFPNIFDVMEEFINFVKNEKICLNQQ
jgi:5-methylcytosine-specific restriction endonuclease McrA